MCSQLLKLMAKPSPVIDKEGFMAARNRFAVPFEGVAQVDSAEAIAETFRVFKGSQPFGARISDLILTLVDLSISRTLTAYAGAASQTSGRSSIYVHGSNQIRYIHTQT